MQFLLAASVFAFALLLAGCGGGPGMPMPDPDPGTVAPGISGLWNATYRYTNELNEVSTWTDALVFAPQSDTTFTIVGAGGGLAGNIALTGNSVSWTSSHDLPAISGTGVYRLTVALSGTHTATALNVQGNSMFELISGTDAEGLDGRSFPLSVTAVRQGAAPRGTAPVLTGTWNASIEVVNPPDWWDDDGSDETVFSGTMVLTQTAPGVYSAVDDQGGYLTIAVVGTTWFGMYDDSDPSLPDYYLRFFLTGPATSTALNGSGTATIITDGADPEGIAGIQLQLSFRATK